ncbi:MAG: hypothetical protein ACHQ1H_12835 [Nitrososphaerales archaeon]
MIPAASPRRRKSTHALFHIRYKTGREKWISLDNQGFSELGIEKMKEKIQDLEKRGKPGQIATLWYMGELSFLKP